MARILLRMTSLRAAIEPPEKHQKYDQTKVKKPFNNLPKSPHDESHKTADIIKLIGNCIKLE
jgi:hypothetical protein